MNEESDVRVLASRISTLDEKIDRVSSHVEKSFSKLDRVADSISELAVQIAKKEEADKHLSIAQAEDRTNIKLLQKDVTELKTIANADQPWKDMKMFVIRSVIVACLLALAGVFFVNPFK